jgi:hypothetical protein
MPTIYPLAEKIDDILDAAVTTVPDASFNVAILDTNDRTYAYNRAFGIQPENGFSALGFSKLLVAECVALANLPLGLDPRQDENTQEIHMHTHEILVDPEDKREYDGILRYAPDNYRTVLSDVLKEALARSDTTALRIAVRALGGPDAVNRIIDEDPDLHEHLHITRLDVIHQAPRTQLPTDQDGMPLDKEGLAIDVTKNPFYSGKTTAEEVAWLFNRVLQRGQYRTMLNTNYNWALRRFIDNPAKFRGRRVREQEPGALRRARILHAFGIHSSHLTDRLVSSSFPETEFPNKEATGDGQIHDVAKIGPYVCAMLSANVPTDNYKQQLMSAYPHAKVGKQVWQAAQVY